MSCRYKHPQWGQCQQPTEGGRCGFHAMRQGQEDQVEPYYHEKVVKGLLTPASTLLTPAETRAMMSGRSHGDGRRLDAYCLDDPVQAA